MSAELFTLSCAHSTYICGLREATRSKTEFAKPRQKEFRSPHVPNFEELGFKVGPFFMG